MVPSVSMNLSHPAAQSAMLEEEKRAGSAADQTGGTA